MSSNSLFGASNSLGSSSTTRQQQAPTSFSSLLAQANSLNETDRDGELPQLRYGLEEIERLSETVAGKGKRAANSRGEGVQLLSNLGVNTAQLTHSVAQLPNAGDVTGARPKRRRQRVLNDNSIPDVGTSYNASQQDVGAWGRNLHETIILSGIEHQRQKTIKSFNDQFQARMLANWEMDKAKILQEELGVTDDEIAKLSSSALGSSTLGKSSLGASTRRFPSAHATATTAASKEGEFVMHTKMVRYERVISDLNSHRLRKAPYELCQAMAQAVKMDNRKEPAHDAFRILAYLTHEPSLSDTAQAEQIQERQYAQAYLGDPYSNHAAKLRGRLTTGGKRYLERDFESYVDETIANNPKEAALGGVPGIENKIRAFVSVLFAAKSNIKEDFKPEYVNDIPLWAQVYYLFRCGYPEEALELLSSKQNLLKREDMTLPGAFRAYLSSPSRKIPKAQKDQLQNDYNGYIKNNANVDQYKYALYRIIGRFDLGRGKVAVASTSTDDWVWLKLTLVREGREDNPSDHYDLAAFGDECWKNGSKTFDAKGTRPFTWVNILLFAGHFEPAIAYLYSRPQNRTDAVHLAIALQYYGLLHVSPPEDPLLTESEEEDVTSINFARLIKNYISPFARVEPQTALQYVYLVPLGSDAPDGVGERQRAVSLELVRDVVLASRAWGKLLGSVRADGSKETGVIEKDAGLLRLPESTDYFRQIVLSAAEQSALDSSLPDSIELYHLANAPDKVIETVNRALGSSLSLPSAQSGPLTSGGLGISGAFGGITDLTTLGERVRAVYDRDTVKRSKIQKGPWDTLELLLQLKRALGEFGAGRPDLALESFKQTKLLPLDNNDSGSIQRSTGLFKALLDQPTISSLDEIIITTMKCLHQLSQQLKQSPYGDKGRMEQINRYKSMAQCLVQFASGMRLRLGPDVYRQLSSMSAFF